MTVKRPLCVTIVVLFGVLALPAFAAWQTGERDGQAYAGIENERGQRLELWVDDRNLVFARMQLGDGFETFAASSCPTFQIDRRKPMHHFELGPRCRVTGKNVTFALGGIVDRKIRSLILHRLLNGNAVTFRYTVGSGQYRQAQFSLTASKQAMRGLLGYNLNVEVEPSTP